jgi:hypothetical protein
MLLQYLEALTPIGTNPATTYVIPAEFTQFVGPLAAGLGAAIAAGAQATRESDEGPAATPGT